ncbi:MAG: thioredoxin domain-containing protein [Gemmatimonadaceae bacterium]
MTTRVRPGILFGGVGLLAGFILGLLTARYNHAQYVEEEPPASASAASPPTAASSAESVAEPLDTTFHLVVTTGRPARGPATAPVTIVEFTDYECPYCQEYFIKTLPLVFAQYGDRVRYVIMNLPIPQLHPDALGAAEAAECAADQGHFWEYHDRLFVESGLNRATLGDIAAQVHLDSAVFARCVDTRATAERVRGHVAQAKSLGVNSTPTFIINGRIFHGAYPFDSFKLIIDSAIVRASH